MSGNASFPGTPSPEEQGWRAYADRPYDCVCGHMAASHEGWGTGACEAMRDGALCPCTAFAAGGDRGDNTARREVVHACPPGTSGFTPCCNRTPFELPRTDRMTVDAELVTCAPAADRQTDECASARRRMLGDTIVDDDASPVASAARVAFRLGWEAAPAARPAVADAVMADLGAAITEGVTEARLREAQARIRQRGEPGAIDVAIRYPHAKLWLWVNRDEWLNDDEVADWPEHPPARTP